MSISVEPFLVHQAAQAANIHAQGQENTFLTSLGPEFLAALYREMALAPECIGYVALEAEDGPRGCSKEPDARQVVGIVVVTLHPDVFLSRILRRGWRHLAPSVLRALLRRPQLLGRIIETLLYPGQDKASQGEAELLFIGVCDAWRRQRIGATLLGAVEQDLLEHGATAMGLTVDDANQQAQAFYRSRGMQPRHQFTLYGRAMHWYSMSLAKAKAPEREREAATL